MSVSAKFIADFTSFTSAVDKAELKLSELRTESGRVESQLRRMGDSFIGKKILQEAELAAKAVQGIGGVSKLTANEQLRLNGIVTEAIAKYRALGEAAPKHLLDIAKATTPVNTGFSGMLGLIKQIGPALGVSFGVGAVVGFAKEIGSFAGKMIDLSAQTRISTTRLQAFNYAGTGVGLTIDDITTSADQLAKRLGGDDKSVNEALKKLNLQGQDLQKLDLDEVMFKIDESLVGVGNQFERARVLADLFGRSGAQMGRLMDGALRGVIKTAEESGAIIDEELLKKADAFDDAWAQAWVKFRAMATDAIGFVGGLLEGLQNIAKHGIQFGVTGPGATEWQRNMKRLGPNDFISNGQVVPGGLSPGQEVWGNGMPEVDEALKAMTAWRDATVKAAKATESWARNLQGEFSMAQDVAFFHSVTSDATKKLQGLMMRAGTPGILPNMNAGLTGGLMFGPGAMTRGGGPGVNPTNFFGRAGGGFLGGLGGGFNKLLKGMTGGGGFGGFMGNLGSGIMGGLGNLLTGGLSGLLSGGVSFITKGLGKLFGGLFGAEGKKTNRARDAAISDFTGISGDKGASQQKFRELATAAGIANSEIDKLFSTKRTKDFEMAMDAITKKMDAFTSEQEADAVRLTAAMEKYGLTIENLGQGEQQRRQDAQAKELMEDWRVLIAAGVEITDVNNAMAGAINEYLQAAIKMGTEVPAAMRPLLQKMLEQGTLTDDAGNAITDLEEAGIQFSETMTEGFDRVVEKLNELIERLGVANLELGKLPTVPTGGQSPPFSESHDVPGFAGGTRGRFLNFGRGTPVMLHGRERVQTAAEGNSEASSVAALIEDMRGIRSDLGWMRSTLPIALRDAVLLSR